MSLFRVEIDPLIAKNKRKKVKIADLYPSIHYRYYWTNSKESVQKWQQSQNMATHQWQHVEEQINNESDHKK